MTELTVMRSRDMELYLDGEPLFGVTHLKASSRYHHHEVTEFLSAQPAALVPQGETHEIALRMLPLLSGGIPADRSFSLRVVGGDEEYLYEDCAVSAHTRDVRGDSIVSDTYTLKAHRMTKGRIQNA